MTVKNIKNVAASVRQRLLNKARSENLPFSGVAALYAMERFLYRLSSSKYCRKFVLKGAFMFRVWNETINRPTMDIDLLGRVSNDPLVLEECIRDVCGETVDADGIYFDPASVKSDAITNDAEYIGRRIRFLGRLENMRIPMQIDIGFGDSVFPAPSEVVIPSMLGYPSPVLIGYTKESAIAEKFHAMVEMGELNSRMKDFFDIWLLSKSFDFQGDVLADSIRFTFEKRKTSLEGNIIAFGEKFGIEKQVQWISFLKRLELMDVPESLRIVTRQIEDFLLPVISSLSRNSAVPSRWKAPGPWK